MTLPITTRPRYNGRVPGDSLTFGLAITGFAMLAADAARRARGDCSAAWTRATVVVIGAHVWCVWSFRLGWSIDRMLEKGLPAALLFHGAFTLLVAATFVREPRRSVLVWLGFGIVCLGALPAPFRYAELAVLRLPTAAIAGAALWVIWRQRQRSSAA
jgi:hypothetical protein